MNYVPSCPEEAAYLKAYDPAKYPINTVTVDLVLLDTPSRSVLLVQRGNWPYKDRWALPGGFVNTNEVIWMAALREVQEETGLVFPATHPDVSSLQLHPLGVADDPDRDPRGRVISHVFCAAGEFMSQVSGRDDAVDARWVHVDDLYTLQPLAFDHDTWVIKALEAAEVPA